MQRVPRILNAQVTNHSRSGRALLPTGVTIGYNAPWRQVEAPLECAAAATEGVRSPRIGAHPSA